MPDSRDERPNCTVVRTAAKYETFYSDVLYGFERDVVWILGQDDHIRNLSPTRLPLSFSSKAA